MNSIKRLLKHVEEGEYWGELGEDAARELDSMLNKIHALETAMNKIGNDKQDTMKHERKEEHIRNIAFCINDGASGYVTDNFRIEDLPVPQRTGTMTQQDAYAKHKARQIFEAFLEQNPNIND